MHKIPVTFFCFYPDLAFFIRILLFLLSRDEICKCFHLSIKVSNLSRPLPPLPLPADKDGTWDTLKESWNMSSSASEAIVVARCWYCSGGTGVVGTQRMWLPAYTPPSLRGRSHYGQKNLQNSTEIKYIYLNL